MEFTASHFSRRPFIPPSGAEAGAINHPPRFVMTHLKNVTRLASAAFLPIRSAHTRSAMLIGAILTVACSDGTDAEHLGGKAGAGGTGGSGGGTSARTAGDAGSALPTMITCTETAPTTPVMCG